jgi:hypothetical protein
MPYSSRSSEQGSAPPKILDQSVTLILALSSAF